MRLVRTTRPQRSTRVALHRLDEVSSGAPDPERLDDFYRKIGLIGGEYSWGTADRPGQIAGWNRMHG